MNLFMFYIGGDVKKANNIELHDVRFSVGETMKDCYDDLRAQWWGDPESLHVDSWGIIRHVDGHDVFLSREPYEGDKKLFFLNVGGYHADEFEEIHKNMMLVDTNPHKAIHRVLVALKEDSWRIPHRDNLFEIEKIISVSEDIAKGGWYVHLKESDEFKPFEFESKYIRLD